MSQFDAVTDDIYNFFSGEFDFSNDVLIEDDCNNKDDSDVSEDLTVSSCEQTIKTSLQPAASTTTYTGTTTGTMIQTTQQKTKTKTTRKYSDLLKEDEMSKAQSLYDRLMSDQLVEKEKKFTKGDAGVARPITGHVRSVYAQMFMNSINSADLINIQNYLSTFMSGPCSFTLNHRVNGSYELPSSLNAFSPQLFSHYLLGCFLSFPDMVVKMNGSRMYTAANGQTKIVMDTDVLCTKMFEVDFDWAPDVEQLSDVYSNMRLTSSSNMVRDDNKSGTISSETATTTANSAATAALIATTEKSKKKPANATSSATKAKKEVVAAEKEDDGSTQGVVPATPTNVAAVRRLPAIPSTYVTNMAQRARMLLTPVPLHTRGTITLYLDSNNCMQHLHVDVTQLDRLTTTETSAAASSSMPPPMAPGGTIPAVAAGSPLQQHRKAPAKRASKPKQQQPPSASNNNNKSSCAVAGSSSA